MEDLRFNFVNHVFIKFSKMEAKVTYQIQKFRNILKCRKTLIRLTLLISKARSIKYKTLQNKEKTILYKIYPIEPLLLLLNFKNIKI